MQGWGIFRNPLCPRAIRVRHPESQVPRHQPSRDTHPESEGMLHPLLTGRFETLSPRAGTRPAGARVVRQRNPVPDNKDPNSKDPDSKGPDRKNLEG